MRVHLKKIASDAREISYAHKGDAGMDLYANESVTLKAGERAVVGTGIKIAFERGYEAQVRPKSGLAADKGITVLNTPGTIDAGYRGEVKVILINLGNEEVSIEKGKKIAQLVFSRVEEAEIEVVGELERTARNDGGFGSTGLD